MKRTILLLILSIIFINVSAQISVGPKIGISLANVSTPQIIEAITPDFRNLPGFEAGIVSEYRFSDRISLIAELNYREKGFRIREDFGLRLFNIPIPVGAGMDARFRYLEMPVLGKFYLQKHSPVSIYLFAGPTLSYAMSGRIRTVANVLFDLELGNINLDLDKLGHNRFELGALAGMGTEFHAGSGNIFVDIRFHRGFSEMYNLPVIKTDIRHHSFGLNIGYRVEL